MSTRPLPAAYVESIVRLHKELGLGYVEIARRLSRHQEFARYATPASVKKQLSKWRKRNAINRFGP